VARFDTVVPGERSGAEPLTSRDKTPVAVGVTSVVKRF